MCNRGDGEPIEGAIKKNGKPDYKGNDSESFSCVILFDLILSIAYIAAGFYKNFCYFRCGRRIESNKSAIHLAKNQVFHARTKHIDVRYHFMLEILKEEEISLQKISTTENAADMMTKVVSKAKFKHCLDLVNILHI